MYYRSAGTGLHRCIGVRLMLRFHSPGGSTFLREMSKVDDFGINRKRVCDFLLVGHCDYGPILHRFWDTATYSLKWPIFPTPLWRHGIMASGITSLWHHIMAAILKSWRQIVNTTQSIDMYLPEEQSCQISSRSDLKRRSLRLFFEEVAPTGRTTTTRRVATWN